MLQLIEGFLYQQHEESCMRNVLIALKICVSSVKLDFTGACEILLVIHSFDVGMLHHNKAL